MRKLTLYLPLCFGLTIFGLSSTATPVFAGSAGGVGGVSAGNVAAVGVGAMTSGGVGGVGGAYPGGKLNHPGPSVIWYPPEYSAKQQRRVGQSCQWLYQKAKATDTRYWRSRHNNCIATR